MSSTEPTIEAEVVEIDDIAVESELPRNDEPRHRSSAAHSAWRSWQGRVKTFDARWWPLWLILGFFALVLVVAVGMCAAVLGFLYWLVKSVIRGIASLFSPPPQLPR